MVVTSEALRATGCRLLTIKAHPLVFRHGIFTVGILLLYKLTFFMLLLTVHFVQL